MNKQFKIGMIGLGKLGKPVLEYFAVKCKNSICYGYDTKTVLSQHFHTMECIKDVCDSATDIVFIAVPTPHNFRYGGEEPTSSLPKKDFDYTIVEEVSLEVAKYKKENQAIVLISTVLPGTIRERFEKYIPDLIYNPYFIAMGTVKEDMEHPEMVVIGYNEEKYNSALDKLLEFYSNLYAKNNNNVRYSIGSWENAEAIKVFYNTYISTKLAFVNMILDFSQKIDHLDANFVCGELAKSDYRLTSPMYMKPGLGDAGACLLPDTLIYTKSGLKEIKDISVGDEVIGKDGIFHKVKRVYRNKHSDDCEIYKGYIIQIKPRGLGEYGCTPDHEIYVSEDLRKEYITNGSLKFNNTSKKENLISEVKKKAASYIKVRYDYSIIPKFIDEYNNVPDYIDDDFVRLCGYYLSAGSLELDERQGRVNFHFNINEKDYHDDVIKLLEKLPYGNKVVKNDNIEKNTTVIRYSSIDLCKNIFYNFSKLSHNKCIPSWIMYGDLNFIRSLLRGMFRGDGSNHEDGITYSTVSKILAHQLQFILYRLGIHCTIKKNKSRFNEYNHRESYEVKINNSLYLEGLSEIVEMGEIRHKMQKKKYRTIFEKDNIFYHKIDKVDNVYYEGDVYDLEIENEHNYLTVSGLVSNCHPRDNIALSYLSEKHDMQYDFFNNIMETREKQAENLAKLVLKTFTKNRCDAIIINGKAYKENVPLIDGSYAMLVAYYCKKNGYPVHYKDPLVDSDYYIDSNSKYVILLAHKKLYFDPPKGSLLVDPWNNCLVTEV